MRRATEVHTTHAHRLLEPTTIGPLALRNRIAVAPMTRVSATVDSVPSERMARYYADFARGGFGLILTEGIYPDSVYAPAYERQPGLATRDQLAGWRRVTDAVHEAGGIIVAQLMHPGALSQCLEDTLAPSAVQPLGEKMPEYGGRGPFRMPRSMSRPEIERAVDGFARSAILAQAAGFDGLEIHGANGYLIDQFLTSYTNARRDEFGGGISGRVRFAVEVLTRDPRGRRMKQLSVDGEHACILRKRRNRRQCLRNDH
jgi:2,4-dienoyl-CoA reductase-like NADH-dependent reductase (Old Yellow Enzyme family)